MSKIFLLIRLFFVFITTKCNNTFFPIIKWFQTRVAIKSKSKAKNNSKFYRRLKKWFNNLSRFKKKFLICFSIGISVELLVIVFLSFGYTPPPIEDTQRWSRDKTMAITRFYQESGFLKPEALPYGLSKFVVFNINDDVWQSPEWGGGEPYKQPRDKIFALSEKAFDSGARIVFLDIGVEGELDASEKEWLTNFANKQYAGEKRHLIVLRSLRQRSNSNTPNLEIRPALWDIYKPTQNSVEIHNALPYFNLDDDLRYRESQTGIYAKNATSNDVIFLPSPQFSLYCITTPLQKQDPSLPVSCDEINKSYDTRVSEVVMNKSNAFASAILFPYGTQGDLGYDDYPALSVLKAEHLDLKNSIVLIGATYLETKDYFHTPIGEISGISLIMNAMDTSLRYGEVKELPYYIKYPLILAIIVLFSYLFASRHYFIAWLISNAALILFFVFILGPWLLLQGRWFDFGLSLIVIELYQLVTEVRDEIKEIRGVKK